MTQEEKRKNKAVESFLAALKKATDNFSTESFEMAASFLNLLSENEILQKKMKTNDGSDK